MQRLALLSHRHLVSLICHQRVLARMKEDGGARSVLFVHLVSFPDGCLVSLRCRKMVLQCQNRTFCNDPTPCFISSTNADLLVSASISRECKSITASSRCIIWHCSDISNSRRSSVGRHGKSILFHFSHSWHLVSDIHDSVCVVSLHHPDV